MSGVAAQRLPSLPHRVAQRSLADTVVVLEVGWVLVTVLRRALSGDDGISEAAAWTVLVLVAAAAWAYAAVVARRPEHATTVAAGLLLADALAVGVFSAAGEVPGRSDNPAVFLSGMACIVAGLTLPGWRGAAAAVGLTAWQILRWDGSEQSWLNRVVLVAVILGTGFAAARFIRRTLLRSADQLDRLLADQLAAQRSRELAVRRDEAATRLRRDLHGTILNTLTAVASGRWTPDVDSGRRWLARDVAVLEGMSGAAEPDGNERLADRLRAVLDEVGSRGLQVDARIAETAEPPPAVSLAIVEAVREALMNVVRHAGTDRAELTVDARPDGQVVVEVTDHGRGADPDRLDRGFGLTQSVVGALQAVGGAASVATGPGKGTRVSLRGPLPDSPPAGAPSLPPLTSVDGPRRVAGVLLLMSLLAAVVGLATSWPAYRDPAPQIMALLLLAAAVWPALIELRRPLPDARPTSGRWLWVPAIIAVPAVVLVSGLPLEGCVRMQYPMYMGTPALVVALAVALARPYVSTLTVGVGFVAAHAALAAPTAAAGLPCAATALNNSANTIQLLLAAMVLVAGLRRHATTAQALLADAEAAHRADTAREAARQEGQRLLAAVGDDVAETIRRLAHGHDDPHDPVVRARSRYHAERLRAALSSARTGDHLHAALARLAETSRGSGPPVTVLGSLPPGAVSPADRRAALSAVTSVMEAVSGRAARAVITLLATRTSAHVLLRVEGVDGATPPAGVEVGPGADGTADWRLDLRLVRGGETRPT